MDCLTVKQELVAFLDNELSAVLKAQIEAHVQGCPACAGEMKALAASWQILNQKELPGLGPDFTASVMKRIRQEVPQAVVPERPQVVGGLIWVFIIIAVIFVGGLLGVLVWGKQKAEVKAVVVPTAVPSQPDVHSQEQASLPEVLAEQPIPFEMPPVPVADNRVPKSFPAPVIPVPVTPAFIKAELNQDRDIIANLDMYEDLEFLRKMDTISDMDVVSSMQESSS